jgi:hypothetical protein
MKTAKLLTKDRSRPMALQRITLTYVPAEDRMRLAGGVKNGDVILLWLTQRLCNQMVRTLAALLEKLAEGRGVLAKDAVLSFQQSASRAEQPPLPPVTAGTEAIPSLVRGIGVRQHGKRFTLAFNFGSDCAEIAFSVQGMHRWLSVLHGRYVKAGWAMQCWPEWFQGSGPKDAAETTLLH